MYGMPGATMQMGGLAGYGGQRAGMQMQPGGYTPSSGFAQSYPPMQQSPIRAPAVTPLPSTQTMPLTPKVQQMSAGLPLDHSQQLQMAVVPQMTAGKISHFAQPMVSMNREQVLEQRVRDLENQLYQKDEAIKDLQAALQNSKIGGTSKKGGRSPGRSGSGFRKVTNSKPVIKYSAVDQDDPIDVRLEEFYNSTGSAVQFRRINRAFYRFGDSIVELDIINHKLMAKTEDGWDRGKFGPIEKILMYYENIEREKAGIVPEA